MLPKVGIYYLFSEMKDRGLCVGFKLDVRGVVESRVNYITRDFYEKTFLDMFNNERAIINECDRHNYQALKIELADKISFREIANEIARIHFDKFLKENSWLREMRR